MAYCRWSDDDWQCDVYVYEHYEGKYVGHVANYRFLGIEIIPKNPELEHEFWDSESKMSKARMGEFLDYHAARKEFISTLQNVKIGGEYDGQTFEVETVDELILVLEDIKSKGYHVPEWVFDTLREECE